MNDKMYINNKDTFNVDRIYPMKSEHQEITTQNELVPGFGSNINSDSDTISLAFLISLSVTFAIIMIILVVLATFITFCSGDEESHYDEESRLRQRSGGIESRRLPLSGIFRRKNNDVLLNSLFIRSPYSVRLDTNGNIDNVETLKKLENQELQKLSNFEISLYERTKEFQRLNPPIITKFGSYTSDNDLKFLKDRGIQSYFLLPSINDNVDKDGNFLPSFFIQDKLDITFTKYNKSSSTILNFPLPYNKRDAVYFEVKIFKYNKKSNSIFSIGLTTVPYPYFRPPGMADFSIAYESTGKLRVNNPFSATTLLPVLEEGDVVGFGYKYRSGAIFITHNGKKVIDVTQDVHIDLFLSIGAFNASYTRTYTLDGLLEDPDNIALRRKLSEGESIDIGDKLNRVYDINKEEIESDPIELNVNLGQLGYVFIEANVKKYSFGSIYGEIGIPPSYNGIEINKDIILQKGDDLPPKYISENEDSLNDHEDVIEGNSNMLLQVLYMK
ncbi:hypothetical protein RI543_003772 [Arxiozyma heterogenica]|uniref:B30.2/SPRY domain-containing protein n=1 Tax=Arxiozyma heterogenica TaxID=278026 RepID=A0AAN8A6K7_9SACH|nr:hypothetical protein RI543_003772 [Kazachstania heterogenica]